MAHHQATVEWWGVLHQVQHHPAHDYQKRGKLWGPATDSVTSRAIFSKYPTTRPMAFRIKDLAFTRRAREAYSYAYGTMASTILTSDDWKQSTMIWVWCGSQAFSTAGGSQRHAAIGALEATAFSDSSTHLSSSLMPLEKISIHSCNKSKSSIVQS